MPNLLNPPSDQLYRWDIAAGLSVTLMPADVERPELASDRICITAMNTYGDLWQILLFVINRVVVPANLIKTFSNNYNTYQIHGLPPGPICNPGLDAIDAALNPARTDYYYYCHSSSGEAFFARTNQVHVTNLKKAGLV